MSNIKCLGQIANADGGSCAAAADVTIASNATADRVVAERTDSAGAPVNPCSTLQVEQELGTKPTAEGEAYLRSKRDNRLSDYRDYVRRFPDGVCRAAAERVLDMREARLRALPAIPGMGPLGPARLRGIEVDPDDYPPLAMRNKQQGRVAVVWEVAEDGSPELCRVVQSSGSDVLAEQNLLSAYGRWKT